MRFAGTWRTVLAVMLIAGGAKAQSTVMLNAAGSTFGYPIYSKWFSEYHKLYPNVQINYASIGSGGGIAQLTSHTVDWGASDGPMTDQQLAAAGFTILHFPTVLGGVMPFYNIPGVNAELKFTPEALADIYLGRVTRWNDPEIASVNPGISLPATDIVVIHRSDGSGTTYIWTDFLSKVSPEWKSRVGTSTSVRWPVGLGGKGSEGVTGLVKQTPGAIGYVELIYALSNQIPYGDVQNPAGVFVKATLDSVSAAAAGAARSMPADFRVSITNAPGKTSYPISSFTWFLIPAKINDAAKLRATKEFLTWMLSKGQAYAAGLAYAPLPHPVVLQEEKAIARIQ